MRYVAALFFIFSAVAHAEMDQDLKTICTITKNYQEYQQGIQTPENAYMTLIFKGQDKNATFDLKAATTKLKTLNENIQNTKNSHFAKTPACALFADADHAVQTDLYNYFLVLNDHPAQNIQTLIEVRTKIDSMFSMYMAKVVQNKQDGLGDNEIHFTGTSTCIADDRAQKQFASLYSERAQLLADIRTNLFGIAKYGQSPNLLQDIAQIDIENAETERYTKPAAVLLPTLLTFVAWEVTAAKISAVALFGVRGAQVANVAKYIGFGGMGAYSGVDFVNKKYNAELFSPNEIQNMLNETLKFTDIKLNSAQEYLPVLSAITESEKEFPHFVVVKVLTRIQDDVGFEKALKKCEKLSQENL